MMWPAAGTGVPASGTSASGAPMSTMAGPAFCAHCIQASIPAWACSGVPVVICSRADTGARYKIMYLVIEEPPQELTLADWQPTARGSAAEGGWGGVGTGLAVRMTALAVGLTALIGSLGRDRAGRGTPARNSS